MSVDALSLAANAFSVIGLADIILRSADILYDIICRATSANKTAAAILQMLQALRQSIKACSDWAATYEQSHFAQDDGRSVSQEIKQVLACCYKEIEKLVKVVQGINSGSTVVRKFNFAVRQEEELQRSTDILLKCVQVLTFHLQSVAGNDLITLRDCHAKTHRNQATTQSTVEKVQSRTEAISQEVQLVQHAATQNSQALANVGRQINNTHESTIQSLSHIEGSVQHLGESSRAIMEQHLLNMQAGFGDISSKLAEITFVESEDCNVMVEGYSLENAIAPLRLISTRLSHAVKTVARTGTQTISSSNLEWFSSEMRKVRQFAYRSAGACNLPPRAFRGPHQTYFSPRCSFATVPLRRSSIKFKDTEGFFVIEHTEAVDNYGRKVQRYRFVSICLRDLTREQIGIVGLIESSQYANHPPQLSRYLRQIAIISSHSPAFFAVNHGNLKYLKALFSARQASPFDYDENGRSLLEGALTQTFRWNEDIILFLLEQGADPYMCHLGQSGPKNLVESMWEPTVLSGPTFLSTVRLTSIVQSRWSIIDEEDDLKSAITRGFITSKIPGLHVWDFLISSVKTSARPGTDFFTELLSQGAANAEYCQRYGFGALKCWAHWGNVKELVKQCFYLFAHALRCPDIPNLNIGRLLQVANGMPPGRIPEGVGPLSIMEHLVNRGVDPSARDHAGRTLLHEIPSEYIATWLLGKGSRVDAQDLEGWTPLHYAVCRSRIGVAGALIEHGANVNARDKSGKTPLSIAGSHQYFNTVLSLRASSLDINAQDSQGTTALSDAVQARTMIPTWVAHRHALLDQQQTCNRGRTAFLYAAQHSQEMLVSFLLFKGASVDQRDDLGRTALSYAAEHATTRTVWLLLCAGASVNRGDTWGKTPLSYTELYRRSENSQLLRCFGGVPYVRNSK